MAKIIPQPLDILYRHLLPTHLLHYNETWLEAPGKHVNSELLFFSFLISKMEDKATILKFLK